MDKLADILQNYPIQEPSEIAAIKNYIMQNFNATANVAFQNNNIVISVNSASLANTLRLRTSQIQSAANTKQKIIFRII